MRLLEYLAIKGADGKALADQERKRLILEHQVKIAFMGLHALQLTLQAWLESDAIHPMIASTLRMVEMTIKSMTDADQALSKEREEKP